MDFCGFTLIATKVLSIEKQKALLTPFYKALLIGTMGRTINRFKKNVDSYCLLPINLFL
jgi:hypothetical protein